MNTMHFLKLVLSFLIIIFWLVFVHCRFVITVTRTSPKSPNHPDPENHSGDKNQSPLIGGSASTVFEKSLDEDSKDNAKNIDVLKEVVGKSGRNFQVVFWKVCLPKMVCELNAINSDQSTSILDALTNMRTTLSIDPTSQFYDRFHFASTMGFLFKNVDGTGCHNLYPECPLSRSQLMLTSKYIVIQ